MPAKKSSSRTKAPAKKAPTRKTSARKSSARKSSARKSTATPSSRGPDVIALIKQDHRTVDDLFKRFKGLGDRALTSKRRTVERLVKELSVHAAVEEQVVYPRIRQVVARGDALVGHALDEHQEAKELLAQLDRMSPEDDGYDQRVGALAKAIREHVREEEREVLPAYKKSVDRDELAEVAAAYRKAKKAAPTRPHPNAPNRPPGNVVAGAVASVVDRARDAGREAVRGR